MCDLVCLQALKRALAGLAVLSAELDGVLRALAVNAVPAAWKGKSFPSLKPLGGYVADLLARLKMLQVCRQRCTWHVRTENRAPRVSHTHTIAMSAHACFVMVAPGAHSRVLKVPPSELTCCLGLCMCMHAGLV